VGVHPNHPKSLEENLGGYFFLTEKTPISSYIGLLHHVMLIKIIGCVWFGAGQGQDGIFHFVVFV